MGQQEDNEQEGPATRAKESVMEGFDDITREAMTKSPGEAVKDDFTDEEEDKEGTGGGTGGNP